MTQNPLRSPFARHATAALLVALVAALSQPALASDALKQGRSALQRNDLGSALPLLHQAVSEEPTNLEAHTTLAQALIQAHQYGEAQAEIAAAAKLTPDDPSVPYLGGRLLEAQDDWTGAIAKYREALARKSKYQEASLALGLALRHEGKPAEALTELNRGLDFASESRVPLFVAATGLALMDLDSLSAAADSAERAAALDPDNSFTQMACGDVYLKKQVWTRAKDFYKRATQIDTLNPVAFFKLGLTHYNSQEYTDALQSFKNAVVLDSLYPDPQYWIGHLYVLAGVADRIRYGDALPYLRNYTRWRPKDGRGWVDLGEALYRQPGNDPDIAKEAAAALDSAVALRPKDTRAYLLQVKNYAYNLNDLDGAFRAFENLQAAGGKLGAEDILLVGSLYMSQRPPQFAVADSLYAEAAKADSSQPDPWYELGESKFLQREYAAAIPYLRRRIAADSAGTNSKAGKPFLPYYMLGQCYNQLGSELLVASQVAGLRPDSVRTLTVQAGVLFDSAAVPLRQALQLGPPPGQELARVHLELGTAYAKGDSLQRGLAPAEFNAVVEADSTDRAAASALYNLAYLDYSQKDYPAAAAKLERAATIDPGRRDILVLLAGCYVLTNDLERARVVAQRGLQLDPSNALFLRIVKSPRKAPAGKGTAPADGQAPPEKPKTK